MDNLATLTQKVNENIKPLLPGAFQGGISVCISAPFDYFKTHAQKRHKWTETLQKVKENPLRLFRGTGLPLIATIPERAIQYSIFEKLKPKYGVIAAALVSAVPSSAMSVITTRYKIEKQLELKTTMRHSVYSLELVRNFSASVLFMGIYAELRDDYDMPTYVAATVSTFSYWTVTYPFCTLKTLALTENTSVRHLIAREGLSLWRGITFVYLRVVPTSILSMWVYEYLRMLIK